MAVLESRYLSCLMQDTSIELVKIAVVAGVENYVSGSQVEMCSSWVSRRLLPSIRGKVSYPNKSMRSVQNMMKVLMNPS